MVVGASVAGLCATRVLADHFGSVQVVDRDLLPTDPGESRRHVPQGRHPHLLLVAGARLLEGWFPGIVSDLYRAGAVELDVSADFYWHQSGGVARRPMSNLKGPSMTRPFLEATVRRRLTLLPNVGVRSACAVEGVDTAEGRVTGVRLDDGTSLSADLVVDATGRQARSLAWLAAAGYRPPRVDVVEVDTRYATQSYRRGDHPARDWKAAAVIGDPATRRLAIALPVEGERWLVLFGESQRRGPAGRRVRPDGMGEEPPVHGNRGSDGGLRTARRSGDAPLPGRPTAPDREDASVPARVGATRRRRLQLDPDLRAGRDICSLKPPPSAACLERSGTVDRRFARRYFKSASKVVSLPSSVAVGGDFAYSGTTGRKPPGTDLLNRYVDASRSLANATTQFRAASAKWPRWSAVQRHCLPRRSCAHVLRSSGQHHRVTGRSIPPAPE